MTKKMLYRVILVAAVSLGLVTSASAQDRTRPASATDFVGVFRLLDYPMQAQPKILKEPLWTNPCQFFGHYPDGYYLHQQTTGAACSNGIPPSKPALPQTVHWKLLRDGVVLVDRSDHKIPELWKVDRVNRASNISGVNLNEGDVIMQLLDRDLKQVLWVRLLRRVGNASNN
jgi:hypothetical protein